MKRQSSAFLFSLLIRSPSGVVAPHKKKGGGGHKKKENKKENYVVPLFCFYLLTNKHLAYLALISTFMLNYYDLSTSPLGRAD